MKHGESDVGARKWMNDLWFRRAYATLAGTAVFGAWLMPYLMLWDDRRLDADVLGHLLYALTGLGVVLLAIWPRRARTDPLGKALRLVFALALTLLWLIIVRFWAS